MPQVAKCECEGFEDCWDSSREEHFMRTIHDEECPKNPERMAEALADYEQERWEEEERERESENEPIPWDDLD